MARLHSLLILAAFALGACGGARVSITTGAEASAEQPAATDSESTDDVGESVKDEGAEADAASGRGRRVESHTGTSGYPTLTLPGFRMLRDGGSRVFVEIAGRVAVKQNKAPRTLTYVLSGVRVPEKVNRMALPTRHFATPVRRVRMSQLDNNRAALVIELRAETVPKSRLRRTANGTVLSIDFPRYEPSKDQDGEGRFVEEIGPRRKKRRKKRTAEASKGAPAAPAATRKQTSKAPPAAKAKEEPPAAKAKEETKPAAPEGEGETKKDEATDKTTESDAKKDSADDARGDSVEDKVE